MKKSFYITTTLPYVNAPLHMGHALEFVRTDTIARYKELTGSEVFFNTGTDEHGAKIYEKANESGILPQEFVDRGFAEFKKSIEMFGMSPDLHFVRTTDPSHIKAAQEFWQRCDQGGYIYKKNYQIKYCVGCESEKSDSELVEGRCAIHPGRELELIDEENYFFRYSLFGEKLSKFYGENPSFVVPEFRFNEVIQFVKSGLEDFSISRLKSKMPWGVPVPGDPEQVMYVWFDALTNYISTLGWPDEGGDFEKFWVNGTPTQYCGKDNTRFQAAMWQAMLMAAGVPNSKQIIVNGFILAGGGVKMSKSLGNVVDPRDVVKEYSTDALRYFLLREVSSFEDSPFTMERFREAYNANLANGLGNLVSRIMKMAEDNFDAPVDVSEQALDAEYSAAMDSFNIQMAIDRVWENIGYCDEYIQSNQPFKVIKNDLAEGKKMIEHMVKELFRIATMLAPALPETSQKIIELIKTNKMPSTPLFLRKD